MGYYCKAPRDCGCTMWDNGNTCAMCREEDCLDLIETYDYRKCSCGADEPPSLYGEGVARQYIEHKHDFESIGWTEFDGYVVECTECIAITGHYAKPEDAVNAWNNAILEYDGDGKI